MEINSLISEMNLADTGRKEGRRRKTVKGHVCRTDSLSQVEMTAIRESRRGRGGTRVPQGQRGAASAGLDTAPDGERQAFGCSQRIQAGVCSLLVTVWSSAPLLPLLDGRQALSWWDEGHLWSLVARPCLHFQALCCGQSLLCCLRIDHIKTTRVLVRFRFLGLA